MLRYIPYVLGIVVLTGATWWQAKIVDRWGMSSISVEDLQNQFDKVPQVIGNWEGEDHEVDEEVQKTAGAVAHVNRIYKNRETGDEVALWLIAGHAKDIVRHTPDVCYPSQGYRQARDEVPHEMNPDDGTKAVFWTARFTPEQELAAGQRRVFWAWSVSPESGNDPQWVAPESARRYFRNTPAVYKMYFTSLVGPRQETAAASPCVEFAKVCIPQVNAALFQSGASSAVPTDASADAGGSTEPDEQAAAAAS